MDHIKQLARKENWEQLNPKCFLLSWLNEIDSKKALWISLFIYLLFNHFSIIFTATYWLRVWSRMIKGYKLASISVANWAVLIKLSNNSKQLLQLTSCVIDSARQELDTRNNFVFQTDINGDKNRKWNSKIRESNFYVFVKGPDVDDNAEKTCEIDFTMTR